MLIDIKYNDKEDEFSYDLTIQMRISRYVKSRFYPAITISTLAPIYLVGGTIRDLINARNPKDLDFVVVGNEHLEWVRSVLSRFGISYSFNRFGGMKFNYNGTDIDLWTTDDLFSSMQYNIDGLYYNVKNGSMLSLTFRDFIDNEVREINPDNNIRVDREKKLLKFAQDFKKE